jgi:DNA-binding transcriptional LysR family regulator
MKLISAQLEAFYTLSQTLNFTKAAEKLHVTQSALSQRILNLEKQLELTLFVRDRSGLRITEAGFKLIRYCQQQMNLEYEVIQSLKSPDSDEVSGVVRIGGFSAVMDTLVIPALSELVKTHPQVTLHVIKRDASILLQMLKNAEIDYVILDDRLNKEELERVLLGKEKNVLVQNKKYQGADVFLDHHPDDDLTLRYLKLGKSKPSKFQRHFLNDSAGLIQGVQQGLGRAVLPLHLIKKNQNIEIVDKNQILEIPLYLYHYVQPYYTQLHTKVVQSLKMHFEHELK